MAEDKEAKKKVFADLDKYCPPGPYWRVMHLSQHLRLCGDLSPDKVLIAHWYAPPQIIPLVDVVKGPKTDMANVELMADILRTWTRSPRVSEICSRLCVTRFQIAFLREVLYLLDNDFVSPQELDEAAKWGLPCG